MGNVLFLQIPPAMLARSNIFHYLCGINETKDMKRRNALWMAALAMVLVGCQQQKTPTGSFAHADGGGQEVVSSEESAECITVEVTDTSMQYGSHRYTMTGNLTAERYDSGAKGCVTFTHVPADYEEFATVYERLLGKTPHGTAAMMPMAMALYGRDRDLGERCIRLICYENNVNPVVSQLKQKFNASPHAPANDPYIQRYLPAAVLKGATPENAYTPTKPYTVEMEASVNRHSDLTFSGKGRIIYLYILGGGWDTHKRQVEIILQPGKELHQVFNCPSLYTQCKNIDGEWQGLE